MIDKHFFEQIFQKLEPESFLYEFLNPIPHRGEGQILLMDNKILNMEMTNFQPESRDMAIFGKSPYQKVVKLHLYCHNF